MPQEAVPDSRNNQIATLAQSFSNVCVDDVSSMENHSTLIHRERVEASTTANTSTHDDPPIAPLTLNKRARDDEIADYRARKIKVVGGGPKELLAVIDGLQAQVDLLTEQHQDRDRPRPFAHSTQSLPETSRIHHNGNQDLPDDPGNMPRVPPNLTLPQLKTQTSMRLDLNDSKGGTHNLERTVSSYKSTELSAFDDGFSREMEEMHKRAREKEGKWESDRAVLSDAIAQLELQLLSERRSLMEAKQAEEEHHGVVRSLHKEIDYLRSCVASLQASLTEQKAAMTALQQKKTDTTSSIDQHDSYAEARRSAQSQITLLEERCSALEKDVKLLRDRESQLMDTAAQQQAHNTILQQDLESQTEESQRLREQLAILGKQLDNSRLDYETVSTRLTELTSALESTKASDVALKKIILHLKEGLQIFKNDTADQEKAPLSSIPLLEGKSSDSRQRDASLQLRAQESTITASTGELAQVVELEKSLDKVNADSLQQEALAVKVESPESSLPSQAHRVQEQLEPKMQVLYSTTEQNVQPEQRDGLPVDVEAKTRSNKRPPSNLNAQRGQPQTRSLPSIRVQREGHLPEGINLWSLHVVELKKWADDHGIPIVGRQPKKQMYIDAIQSSANIPSSAEIQGIMNDRPLSKKGSA
ncbi:hypothetical protein CVT24_009902 [Panaeolus cyanescens]|uniref:Uncharacterized protein n=1 Tax=Panaeolus cyanescens TaxID=181874 RepID=A0A409WS39_9AGAR|nr:hypothetical protein CVT24_009902 [Panaeolus cyanescens]